MAFRSASLVVLFLLLYWGCIGAREVRGSVSSEAGEKLTGVAITLLELPDSIYLDDGLTDAKGSFALTAGEDTHELIVKSEKFGYESQYNPVETQPIQITLVPVASQLQELEVRASKPTVQKKAGKMIFTPGDLVKNSPNAIELLKWVPMLSVQGDNIGILGKSGTLIFINGRLPIEPQDAVKARLRTQWAGAVKRIEVITSPDAALRGSYDGPIINLIIDDPSQGFVGQARLWEGYAARRASSMPSVWGGFRHKGWSFSSTLSYTNSNAQTEKLNTYDYLLLGRHEENRLENNVRSNTINASLTLQYDLSPRSVIGAAAYIFDAESKSSFDTHTTIFQDKDPDHKEFGWFQRTARKGFGRPGYGIVGFYSLDTDRRGSRLTVRADYSNEGTKYNQNEISDTFEKTYEDFNKRAGYNAKADYVQKFRSGAKLSAGYDIKGADLDYDRDTGSALRDHFIYKDL